MVIDALPTTIAHFLADPGLTAIVDQRVAGKHLYGAQPNGWQSANPAQSAIVVAYDPGATPNHDDDVQNARLFALCYGSSKAAASAIYRPLVRLVRSHNGKFEVDTPHGRALVYWLVFDGSPSHQFDDDVNVDYLQVPLRIQLYEHPLDA